MFFNKLTKGQKRMRVGYGLLIGKQQDPKTGKWKFRPAFGFYRQHGHYLDPNWPASIPAHGNFRTRHEAERWAARHVTVPYRVIGLRVGTDCIESFYSRES